MASKPNLNPEPIPGPAEINAAMVKKTSEYSQTPHAAPAAPAGTWPGAFEIVGEVFNQIKKNPEPAYFFISVYVALAFLGQLSTGFASPMDVDATSKPESLVSLIFLLALPVYTLALAERKPITISQFIKFDLGRYLTVFGVAILTVILVVLAAIPLLFLLIWVVPWLSLATYAAVDRKMGVIDSLKESKRLAQNNKSKVWGVIGLTILLAMLAGIFSFLPLIGAAAAAAISLLSAGAMANLYRWLQKNVPAEVV